MAPLLADGLAQPLAESSALDRFLAGCAEEIERRLPFVDAHVAELRSGHAAFAAALAQAAPVDGDRATIPAAECLADAPRSPLLDAARAAAPELHWIPSPRLPDVDGTDAGLAPINHVRDLGDVECGLMVLCPGATYPLHAHPPQELYLPITGDGRWRYGGSEEFRTLEPDALVYNNPRDLHSVEADAEPLLALYVLWPS